MVCHSARHVWGLGSGNGSGTVLPQVPTIDIERSMMHWAVPSRRDNLVAAWPHHRHVFLQQSPWQNRTRRISHGVTLRAHPDETLTTIQLSQLPLSHNQRPKGPNAWSLLRNPALNPPRTTPSPVVTSPLAGDLHPTCQVTRGRESFCAKLVVTSLTVFFSHVHLQDRG